MTLAVRQTTPAVAIAYGGNRTTILCYQRRFQMTGDIVNRPCTGKAIVTTTSTARFITLTHLRRRFKTASSTARECGISGQTFLNRLRKVCSPIRSRGSYGGLIINHRNRNARMQSCRRHLRWRRAQCARFLFTDQSRFNLSHADGIVCVYRRKGELFADSCADSRRRHSTLRAVYA